MNYIIPSKVLSTLLEDIALGNFRPHLCPQSQTIRWSYKDDGTIYFRCLNDKQGLQMVSLCDEMVSQPQAQEIVKAVDNKLRADQSITTDKRHKDLTEKLVGSYLK